MGLHLKILDITCFSLPDPSWQLPLGAELNALYVLCFSQRPFGAVAMGGALARPSWLSSPTLGRANRFLSTAAVSLMTPRRPLTQPDKVKVRTLAVEHRTEEDSEWPFSTSV